MWFRSCKISVHSLLFEIHSQCGKNGYIRNILIQLNSFDKMYLKMLLKVSLLLVSNSARERYTLIKFVVVYVVVVILILKMWYSVFRCLLDILTVHNIRVDIRSNHLCRLQFCYCRQSIWDDIVAERDEGVPTELSRVLILVIRIELIDVVDRFILSLSRYTTGKIGSRVVCTWAGCRWYFVMWILILRNRRGSKLKWNSLWEKNSTHIRLVVKSIFTICCDIIRIWIQWHLIQSRVNLIVLIIFHEELHVDGIFLHFTCRTIRSLLAKLISWNILFLALAVSNTKCCRNKNQFSF